MSEPTPCGDTTCHCCYPEFRCDHNQEPRDAEPGDVHGCPDCGAVLVAIAWDEMPELAQRTRARALAKIAETHERRGTTPPVQPTTSWRQLAPSTRIPGALP